MAIDLKNVGRFLLATLLMSGVAIGQNESLDNLADDDFNVEDDGMSQSDDDNFLENNYDNEYEENSNEDDDLLGGDEDLDFNTQSNPGSNNQYSAETTADQSGPNGFGANNNNNQGQAQANQTNPADMQAQTVNQNEYAEPAADQYQDDYSESTQAPVEEEVVVTPNSFSGVEPVPNTMRVMAEGEAPQEYIVEEGDTLFDICDQLLSEGGYWPKLWALNPFIKNPHFIWPGMKLQFYPGDEETPPFLQIVNEDDVVPVDTANLDSSELLYGQVPSVDRFFQVIGSDVIDVADVDSFNLEDGIADEGVIFNATAIDVTLPGFIYSEEVEVLGEVIGGVGGEYLNGVDKKILVSTDGGLSEGQVYSVVRYQDEIANFSLDEEIGYLYQFIGNVKVLKSYPEEGVVEVQTLDGFDATFPEDILIPYTATTRRVSLLDGSATSSVDDASIVGFETIGVESGSDGVMAFIDRGSSNGVSVGQLLNIYQLPADFALDEVGADVEGLRFPVGQIRIIDTTDVGAVGYAVTGRAEVKLGDRVGKG